MALDAAVCVEGGVVEPVGKRVLAVGREAVGNDSSLLDRRACSRTSG